MRKKSKKQMPLIEPAIDHPKAAELEAISRILDSNPTISELAFQDLCRGKNRKRRSGANGMTADQVVRAAIVKQMLNFTNQELSFHIVVQSNIHDPLDSSLLFDSVRVLTRLLCKARENFGLRISFTNHSRRAKKRSLAILNAKSKKARKNQYIDLIKVARKTMGYAGRAIEAIDRTVSAGLGIVALRLDLSHYNDLAARVVDQTQRRVILNQKVPASEKVVSIFEEHTDIIVKDRRDTFFGHKICLTGGASNLIVDCVITGGNPADSTLTQQMLDRQKEIYGKYPLKVALDGGFASKQNLKEAKKKKIKDVCFAKKRGLAVEDMCRSQWVYKRLRRFRAGIESGISWVKRCFGLTRCTWKGLRSFKCYVWASIVSANLLAIARKQLA